MFRPSEATLSRSITSSTSGWSILVSMIGGKANMPLAAAFCCNLLRKFQNHLRLGGGGDDELDRELAAAGQRGRGGDDGANAGDAAHLLLHLRGELRTRCASVRPRV